MKTIKGTELADKEFEILNDGNVKRYLVTYFCPMYRKPQSKQLTDTDVVTYMSKGVFNKLCKKCGGADGKNR